jgi:hypothetical protein
MAARLNRMHTDSVRAKIKIGNIIDRLEKHIAGEIELTSTQVTSAKILLDKTMSNAPQEIKNEISGNMNITTIKRIIVDGTEHKNT